MTASEKPAASGPVGVDEPAGVADSMSALSLSGQEAMQTLNTLCKTAANGGALSTSGLGLTGVQCLGLFSFYGASMSHCTPCALYAVWKIAAATPA